MNENVMVKVPHSAAAIGLRLITQALETLVTGSAIKRHKDAQLAFQAALSCDSGDQVLEVPPDWMNPGVGAQLARASSQVLWAIGDDARLAAEVKALKKALEDWAMDNPPPPLVSLEWGECQRIADVPSVHEALKAFSGDATGDAGVLVIKAVVEAAFTLLTADGQSHREQH